MSLGMLICAGQPSYSGLGRRQGTSVIVRKMKAPPPPIAYRL